MKTLTRFAVSSAAVALLAGTSALPASAAPLGAKFETLEAAAPVASETVQWRRHHYRGRNLGIGLGAFGAGVVIGSAIANQGYYYDQPYGYYEQPYGYYQQPYGYSYSNGNQPNGYEDLSDVVK
jgi:hypothetical protein